MPESPCVEETEEALLEGDSRFAPGTALAALRHAVFRTMFIGGFLSNIGTWMQTVVLGAYAHERTGSAALVGGLVFAQMGPVLLMGPLAGVIADTFDRKRLLIAVTSVQIASASVLAVLAAGDPSVWAIIGCVVVGGFGNALFMPAYSALLPALVGRDDLPGAISLQSTQMNLSRVIGPAIGGLAFATFGASIVFWINAASYLFLIGALLRVELPAVVAPKGEADRGFARITSGFRIAGSDRVLFRSLTTIAVFSGLCLLWVGQLPVFASDELGLQERSTAYGILYACFGLGAAMGSLAIGTVLAGVPRATLVRRGFALYALVQGVFAVLDHPAPAYPVIVVLGAVYFGSVTALNTAMQSRLADHQRGRVMAIWQMGFAGMVSIANLVFGPVIEHTGLPPLMLAGSVLCLGLAWWADVRPPEDVAGAGEAGDGPMAAPTPTAAD